MDVVFVDPDNGLEIPSTPIYASRAPKHAYLSELGKFTRRGQTLVIYHHLGRRPHVPEIFARIEQCEAAFGSPVTAVRYRRGTSRAFFVVPARAHQALLQKRLSTMLNGPWSRHFELVAATQPRTRRPTVDSRVDSNLGG